jgi:hypothetical protein
MSTLDQSQMQFSTTMFQRFQAALCSKVGKIPSPNRGIVVIQTADNIKTEYKQHKPGMYVIFDVSSAVTIRNAVF